MKKIYQKWFKLKSESRSVYKLFLILTFFHFFLPTKQQIDNNSTNLSTNTTTLTPDIQNTLNDLKSAINLVFLFFAGVVIFIMQAGFAMLEGGSVTETDAVNIVWKNLLDVVGVAIIFWIVGFAFAFGEGNKFIGWKYFCSSNLPDNKYDFIFWFFEFNFIATATTIVSGGVAGRIKFQGYLLYVILMNVIIYPPIAHWVWSGGGFLSVNQNVGIFGLGVIDFAGSSVVHITGGACSFTGAWLLGYRNQYISADNIQNFPPRFEKLENGKWKTNPMVASNPVIAALGVFLLWVSWYGFNCGSIIMLTGNLKNVGRVCINTTLSPAFGAITATLVGSLLKSLKKKKTIWSLDDIMNGLLTGLVAITGPCAVVEPWATVPIGIVAGIIFLFGKWLLKKIRVDDPLLSCVVHGMGGFWGQIAGGLFCKQEWISDVFPSANASSYGLFMGGGGARLGSQVLGALIVFAWSFALSFILFFLMSRIDLNRITPLFTIRGKQENISFGDEEIVRKVPVNFVSAQQLKLASEEKESPPFTHVTSKNEENSIEFDNFGVPIENGTKIEHEFNSTTFNLKRGTK